MECDLTDSQGQEAAEVCGVAVNSDCCHGNRARSSRAGKRDCDKIGDRVTWGVHGTDLIRRKPRLATSRVRSAICNLLQS